MIILYGICILVLFLLDEISLGVFWICVGIIMICDYIVGTKNGTF